MAAVWLRRSYIGYRASLIEMVRSHGEKVWHTSQREKCIANTCGTGTWDFSLQPNEVKTHKMNPTIYGIKWERREYVCVLKSMPIEFQLLSKRRRERVRIFAYKPVTMVALESARRLLSTRFACARQQSMSVHHKMFWTNCVVIKGGRAGLKTATTNNGRVNETNKYLYKSDWDGVIEIRP